MRTKHLKYSEAFAGSGEFAAIMMVRSIAQASEKSLVLLDEPETSLHPGAQLELMNFIVDQTKRKKLQVVVASHSPTLISRLPPNAVKILEPNPTTGDVEVVAQEGLVAEAFHRLGAAATNRTIFVEDALAREIVLRSIRLLGIGLLQATKVQAVPGGVSQLLCSLLPAMALEDSGCLFLVDGDQRPADGSVLTSAQNTLDADLVQQLKERGITDVQYKNGGNDVSADQHNAFLRDVLAYSETHLDYLPGTALNPEEWLCEMLNVTALNSTDAKSYWVNETRRVRSLLPQEQPTASDILACQTYAVASLDDKLFEGLSQRIASWH